MLIILALIGFISTTKLTHCAFSLCPVYCYLLMAVIAMDSTLENELSEATCTMAYATEWACARSTLYPHFYGSSVLVLLDLCLDGNTVQVQRLWA